MREKGVLKKRATCLFFGLLFFLCVGIGTVAVRGEAEEQISILDEQNMDAAGVIYTIDESSGEAVLKTMDWEKCGTMEGDIVIYVPQKVCKGENLYPVRQIDLDPDALRTGSGVQQDYNDKIKGRLVFHIGTNIQKAVFKNINSSKLYCEVNTENEYLYSFDGSIANKVTKTLIHFYDGNYSEDDIYTVPDGMRGIGHSAFYSTKLKSVIFPDSLTEIAEYAFYKAKIVYIDLNCVERAKDACFERCDYLEEVKIEKGVKIGLFAFFRCVSLKNIFLPSGSSLAQWAFSKCDSLQTVLISENTILKQVETTSDIFQGCPNIRTMILPEDLKEIPGYFMDGSYSIRKLYIPDSVETMQIASLRGCRMTVYAKKDSVAEDHADGNQLIFQSTQNHSHKMKDVTFFSYGTWAVTGKYCPACGYGTEYKKVDIKCEADRAALPEMLVYTEETCDESRRLDKNNMDSQYLLYTLNEMTMTASVKDHFGSFETNKKINVPEKVIKGGKEYKVVEVLSHAFYTVWNVRLPDTVQYLDEEMFDWANNSFDKKYLHLGSGVEKINQKALRWVTMKEITVSEQNPAFLCENGCLFDKNKTRLLKYVDCQDDRKEERVYTVPDTVTKIDSGAFYKITGLKQINIYARKDLKISEDAFERCTAKINYLDYVPSGTAADVQSDKVVLDENNMDSQGRIYEFTKTHHPDGTDSYNASLIDIDVDRYKEQAGDIDIWVPEEVEKNGATYPVTEICFNIIAPPAANTPKIASVNLLQGRMVLHISDEITHLMAAGINADKLYCESGIANRSYFSYRGSLYTRDMKTLVHCYDGDCNPEDEFTVLDSVTAIDNYAFYGTKLKKIRLPDGVKKIGVYAFADSNVSEINLEQVTTIFSEAFRNTRITKVCLKEEATINDGCFSGCLKLREVRFCKPVTIWRRVFSCSKNAETTLNLYIPEGSWIDTNAFDDSNVETVIIEPCNFDKGIRFWQCKKLKMLMLPTGWTTLPSDFIPYAGMKKIYIPDSVENVGEESCIAENLKVYAKEGSVVENCCNGGARFHSLKNHVHELKDVTFFAYDTWAVTGKYCPLCGYGTEYGTVEIKGEADKKALPVQVSGNEELDEDNTDLQGVIYKLDKDMKTAHVVGMDKEKMDRRNPEYYADIPQEVWKENECYSVTAVEDYALESAKSIYLGDSITTVGILGEAAHTLDYLYIGASVKKIDDRSWENVWIKEVCVSTQNCDFECIGRVLMNTKTKTLLKFIDYGWGEEERSYTIPDTVKAVGAGAFYRIKELNEIIVNIKDTGIELPPSAMTECTAKLVYKCEGEDIKILNEECKDEDGWLYSCSSIDSRRTAAFTGIEWKKYEHVVEDVDIDVPERVIKDGLVYTVDRIDLNPFLTMERPTDYDPNDMIKEKLVFHIGKNIKKASFRKIKSSKLYCEADPNSEYLVSDRGTLMKRDKSVLIHFYDGAYTKDDIYQVPEGVQEIAVHAFDNAQIKSVVLPYSVKRINEYAFWESSISRIDLNQVSKLGYYCFGDCRKLREVKISRSVDIGWYTFAWTTLLENIYIPSGSKLASYAFSGSGVQRVVMGSNCTFNEGQDGVQIFSNCSQLEVMILPEDLKAIPSTFLPCCRRIRKLYIPDSLESIGAGSFSNCKITLCGNEGSVAKDCDEGRQIKFQNLKGHVHELEDVTFFSYRTWVLTGKYCYECGYGTQYGIVELKQGGGNGELPKMLMLKEEHSEKEILDENNTDKDYLIYKLDDSKMTASVIGMKATANQNGYIDIPSKVIKDGAEYTVESIEDYAMESAREIHMSDTIRKLGCLHKLQQYSIPCYQTIYMGAGVEELDEETWANFTVNKIVVSEKNPNYLCDGRALFTKDKTKLLKYINDDGGTDEKRTYTVPDTVTSIGAGTFYGIQNLEQINIRKSENLKISPTAFDSCTAKIHYIEPEPTPTPMPTPTATPTPEPTPTPTPTLTPTAAPTASEPTPTPTATPTSEPTPTAAPTATPTSEPTPTPTAAPTATPTSEPTPTAAPTATSTSEPTPTAAPTPTATPESTPTVAPTATPTQEPTPTATATPTAMPTWMPTPNHVSIPVKSLTISRFCVKLTTRNNVSLSWNKNPYVSGYRIFRAKKKTGVYKMLTDLPGTATSYKDKTVKRNKTYYYRMEGYRTLSGKTITGTETSAKSVKVLSFAAPKIAIWKGKLKKIRFITIHLKKYKGKYAEIYVAVGRKRFEKLKLVSSKIAKYKKKFKISYKVKKKVLRVKVRTFAKKKKKKLYSSYSKIVTIKV